MGADGFAPRGRGSHRVACGALAKTSAPYRRRLRRLHRLKTCATKKGQRLAEGVV